MKVLILALALVTVGCETTAPRRPCTDPVMLEKYGSAEDCKEARTDPIGYRCHTRLAGRYGSYGECIRTEQARQDARDAEWLRENNAYTNGMNAAGQTAGRAFMPPPPSTTVIINEPSP